MSPDDADALAAVQLVAELPAPTTVVLLAQALERESLVTRALEVAGGVGSIEVVELLERGSDAARANLPALLRALVKLARPGNTEEVVKRAASSAVSAAAQGLADGTLAPSEVLLLGRVESAESVALLAQALRAPALQDAAEEALAQLSRRRHAPPEVTRAAADALTSFLSDRKLGVADLEILGAVDSVSSVELLEQVSDSGDLGDVATDALTRLGQSPDPEVASRAERSGTSFPARRVESAQAPALGPKLDAHVRSLTGRLLEGRVVAFLGDASNLIGRSDREDWRRAVHPPTRNELARHLAEACGFPPERLAGLASVTQFAEAVVGRGWLYDELHAVYAADFAPNPLHHFLVRVAAGARAASAPGRYPLIVTLNYDTSLERAFQLAAEPFDVVTYIADGQDAGLFLHQPADHEPIVIQRPNEYTALSLHERTTILKLLGGVDHENPDRDSFLVSEDDAISQLARGDLVGMLPVTLVAALRTNHPLFLGCNLADWVLRAVLARLLLNARRRYVSWAVGASGDELEAHYWKMRGVEVVDVALDRYVAAVTSAFDVESRA